MSDYSAGYDDASGHLDELREALAQSDDALAVCAARRRELEAEVARLRPVVDAAIAWHAAGSHSSRTDAEWINADETFEALWDAVAAFRAATPGSET